jgi:pimeloyl-ACP methyl ester carboxylesterase
MPLQPRMPEAVVVRRPEAPASAVFYLHGFASSARSTKAGYFARQLERYGVTFRCPDFNEPDFASLTMTRMLDQLEHELNASRSPPQAPVTLMGSSLGGTLAILAAARFADRVDRVVLLAPAVMFARPGHHLLPPERVETWRHQGVLRFFHYAYNEERPLAFSFYEDSLKYDAFGTLFTQPALVFQGMRDASVDYRTVEQFAAGRSNVTLSLLDDDHQLAASLPRIWEDVAPFLGVE